MKNKITDVEPLTGPEVENIQAECHRVLESHKFMTMEAEAKASERPFSGISELADSIGITEDALEIFLEDGTAEGGVVNQLRKFKEKYEAMQRNFTL